MDFLNILKAKGSKISESLTAFVHNFLQDPAIFFDLTGTERDGMEKKLDEALAFFKIEKS